MAMTNHTTFLPVGESSIDRPLIAYAFLAQTRHATGDLFTGLAPIFKPIAKHRSGQLFVPKEFADLAKSLYGIDIHPWAVEDLGPRFEKAGLLTKVSLPAKLYEYRYAAIHEEFDAVGETDIQHVLDCFVVFATPILNRHVLTIDRSALEKAFLSQLVDMDFQSILLKPESKPLLTSTASKQKLALPPKPERVAWQQEINAKAKIDVLCASFILHLYETQRELYDLLTRISAGALVAETVLNFQNPGSENSLVGLNVILDAPFVMALLDLCGEESTAYARRICEQLTANGANIQVFRHSVEEITSNLKGTITSTEHNEGYGPTARRMSRASFNSYVRSVVQDVDGAVRRLNYAIVEVPTSASTFQFFSEGDEQQLLSSIGYYEHPMAQKRDADSIAAIMRMRQGKTAKMSSFQRAQYIFITANDRLARRSDRCTTTLKQRNFGDVPPALTDKYLAGLLFVLYGGGASELTHLRLLSNCAAALEPRSDVMRRMHAFLSELDQTKADHFRALMTNERASQHMMQLTLGDAEVLRSGASADEILGQMEATLGEKFAREAETQRQQMAKEHEEQRNAIEARYQETKEQLLGVRTQNLEIDSELRQTRVALEAVKSALDKRQTDDREITRSRLLSCVNDSIRAVDLRRKLISIVVAMLTGTIAFISAKWGSDLHTFEIVVLTIITGVLAYVGFWRTPDKVFGEHLLAYRKKIFESRVFELGLVAECANYAINWEPPCVTDRCEGTQ